MSLADRMMARFRKRLVRFVEKEKAKAGCAKAAMQKVSAKLGMSEIAVYRAMNGYGPVTVKMHHHAALILHTVLGKVPARRLPRRKYVPASFSATH